MIGPARNFPPIAFHTMSDDVALSTPIVVQMIGKARGGGIHPGLFLCSISLDKERESREQ